MCIGQKWCEDKVNGIEAWAESAFEDRLTCPGGDLCKLAGYELSRKGRRIPTVLTREQCQRLFAELEGATRLMAELMYGGGPAPE